MKKALERRKVVVVGGGFAGIETVRTLAKKHAAFDITLISSQTCFQYYPSLYRLVVGATVNQVSIPLTEAMPKGVTLIIDTYTAVDQTTRTITLKSGTTMQYDFLVLALGSEPNYFGIDGMEAKSKSFLSIDKALSLNAHFSETIKNSKALSVEDARMQLRTIIVGAGPSGVEIAGALPDYLRALAKEHGVDPTLISVELLDSSSRVLPALPEAGSTLVQDRLKKRGVTIYSNHSVNSCDTNCIKATEKKGEAQEQKELHAGTIIWTAGTKINSTFTTIPNVVLTEKKRVQASPTLTLPNDDRIYIAGDGSGTPFSGLAQTAIDQGKYVGRTIIRRVKNVPVPPYVPKQGVFVIPVGKYWGILSYKEFLLHGFTAWIMRIIVDADYFLHITSLPYVISMLKKEK